MADVEQTDQAVSERDDQTAKYERWSKVIIYVFGFLAVGAFAWGVAMLVVDWQEARFTEEMAQMGDFWGGHVAIIGAVAGTFLFAGTLLLQNLELKMQRLELARSREVSEKQEKAMAEQAAELKEQNAQLLLQAEGMEARGEVDLMLALLDRFERAETAASKKLAIHSALLRSQVAWGNKKGVLSGLMIFLTHATVDYDISGVCDELLPKYREKVSRNTDSEDRSEKLREFDEWQTRVRQIIQFAKVLTDE